MSEEEGEGGGHKLVLAECGSTVNHHSESSSSTRQVAGREGPEMGGLGVLQQFAGETAPY